jgi:hypothetical protein
MAAGFPSTTRELKRMRMRLFVVLAVGVFSACGTNGPAVMEFVEVSPAQPKIGDVATVRFRLYDSRGVPLAGTTVDFKLQSPNTGVTLNPTSAVSIRGSGYAETQIVASSRVNSVIVVATAGDKQVFSPPITFAGTVPNGRQLTFQCGPVAAAGSGGRHAIGAYDATRYLIAGSAIDCTAHVADRNGDGVTDALVSFMTEAGAIGPSDVSKSNLVGDATVKHKTSLPLPVDVSPDTFSWTPPRDDPSNTGEYLAPLWMHPFNWAEDPLALATTPNARPDLREPRRPDPIRFRPDGSGRYENNPRDNLVSLVAVTSGEEGFTDTDNDGKYTEGEEFDDLTEPFVDSNDNGTWDADERFIDVNGNKKWDGKNGKWDANTLIWRQERLLWTGIPLTIDTLKATQLPPPGIAGHRPVFQAASPATIALYCPCAAGPGMCPTGGSLCASAGPPVLVTAFLADPWFNSLAQNGDSDSCSIEVGEKSPVKAAANTGTGIAFTYPAGQYISFVISDARDPLASPMESAPKRFPPIDFRVTISCTYTSAPTDSYVVKLPVGSITGTIE